MDAVSKYYAISEVLNDNLRDVAIAIRISGCNQKPAYIHSELIEGRVEKFNEEFDFMLDLIKTPQSLYLLQAYIRDIKKLSHKFKFSMTHETRIGAINPNYQSKRVDKIVMGQVREDKHQMLILFEEEK